MTDGIATFSFDSPGSIYVDWGGARRVGETLSGWFSQRNLLIVTDRFLHESGALDPALASLAASGFSVTVFDQVVADPPEAVLMACVEQGKAAGADLVMGLGGGSSMDIAKLAAVLLVTAQELSDLYGIGKIRGARTPLVQVPTTAGTGSEMTNITILTTGETTKMGIIGHQLYADRVLLDAELTLGLPAVQTAATGIDAMVHAIEAFTSKHLKNPLSDVFAREAMRLMAPNLVTACTQPDNRAAREAMLLGSALAGQAFANSPVAAVHAGLSVGRSLPPAARANQCVDAGAGPALQHTRRRAALCGTGGCCARPFRRGRASPRGGLRCLHGGPDGPLRRAASPARLPGHRGEPANVGPRRNAAV